MEESFSKFHRIFLKKEIDRVFAVKEKTHVFPFLSHCYFEPNEAPSFRVIISVPKKKIKQAHDRNRIKRLIRESLRKNKAPLLSLAQEKKCSIIFSIVYLWEEVPADNLIDIKLKKLIAKLCSNTSHEP
jgi:ribonuclease P protein component